MKTISILSAMVITASSCAACLNDQPLAATLDGFASGLSGVPPGTYYTPPPQVAGGSGNQGSGDQGPGQGAVKMGAAQCMAIYREVRYGIQPGDGSYERARQLSYVFNANCLARCRQVGTGTTADLQCND